jgi:thiazole/oxazole-forming peptide maturase SagD family component
MENLANRVAFHPLLLSTAAPFCEELETLLAKSHPAFSVSVNIVPYASSTLKPELSCPVLQLWLDDAETLCGPLYLPGNSVCPECMRHWLDMNFCHHPGPQVTPGAEVAHLLAEKVAEWSTALLAGDSLEALQAGAISIAYSDRKTAWHPLFPRRNCPRCSHLVEADVPLRIHCSRWTGIVNSMELTSVPSAGAYRATATWTPPLPIGDARPGLRRQNSYGRGKTRQEAEIGCIGEALERHSLIYRGDEPLIRAAFSDVDAIHPNDIQLFSESQYRHRQEWNALADEMFYVGDPFQPDTPVDWLEAKSLAAGGESKLVAAACCLMWYQFHAGEPEFARADTIGCGSGRTFDAAFAHALLEWIERDAMAIWWDNRLQRPGLRLESFESRELEEVARGLRAIGRDLFLLDCSTDIGIPAYISVAPRFDGSEPLIAAAAHLSARIAAYKAASEVGQVWHEANRSRTLPSCLETWLLRQTTATQQYLLPHGFIDAPHESAPPAENFCAYIVHRLAAAGLQAYSVDHSRPDVLSRTVRAIVPGLRHIWNRRAPGRLYDVPVKLGWLNRPNVEAELNPIRCMI